MKEFVTKLEGQFDRYMIRFSSKIGVPFLRYAIGIIFIWFGALKMIGELSPAYDLVAATIYWLTPEIIVPLLGLWEIAIGVAFLIPALTRVGIVLLAFQMPGDLFATRTTSRDLLHGYSFWSNSRGSVHCEEPGNHWFRPCDRGGSAHQKVRQSCYLHFQER